MCIRDRQGHESVDITYKYAHLFPSKQQEMAQKLDIDVYKRQGCSSASAASAASGMAGSMPASSEVEEVSSEVRCV